MGKKNTFTSREAEAEEFTVVESEVEVDGKKATGSPIRDRHRPVAAAAA